MHTAEAQLGRFFLEMWGQRTPRMSFDKFVRHVTPLMSKDLFNADLLEPYIRFDSQNYTRNVICQTPQFALLVLCWKLQQFSSIHDHASSVSAVYVHQGKMTSREFASMPNSPVVLEKEELIQDGEFVMADDNIVHQLGNANDSNLVTVHIYSPPLTIINKYDINTPEVSVLDLQQSV